jgi:ABC-type amino acid transport substrate-binding protein
MQAPAEAADFSSSLLLHRYRHVAISGQTHLISFDLSDQTAVNVVMVTFMGAFAAVSLGQFDAVILDTINCADMNAVGADNFHMFSDATHIDHSVLP